MFSLGDFTGAFIGWRYYDYKINQQKPYLDDQTGKISKDKSIKTEFSDEKTIKGLQKRYRKQYNSKGFFTYEQWEKVVRFYAGPANLCLKCNDKKFLIPDHIISASLGGSNSIENIQPLCVSCNSEKRSDVVDYRPDKGNFAEIISCL